MLFNTVDVQDYTRRDTTQKETIQSENLSVHLGGEI
jgi:hypothetical protein